MLKRRETFKFLEQLSNISLYIHCIYISCQRLWTLHQTYIQSKSAVPAHQHCRALTPDAVKLRNSLSSTWTSDHLTCALQQKCHLHFIHDLHTHWQAWIQGKWGFSLTRHGVKLWNQNMLKNHPRDEMIMADLCGWPLCMVTLQRSWETNWMGNLRFRHAPMQCSLQLTARYCWPAPFMAPKNKQTNRSKNLKDHPVYCGIVWLRSSPNIIIRKHSPAWKEAVKILPNHSGSIWQFLIIPKSAPSSTPCFQAASLQRCIQLHPRSLWRKGWEDMGTRILMQTMRGHVFVQRNVQSSSWRG